MPPRGGPKGSYARPRRAVYFTQEPRLYRPGLDDGRKLIMKTIILSLAVLLTSVSLTEAGGNTALEQLCCPGGMPAGAIAVPVAERAVAVPQSLAQKYAYLDPDGLVPAALLAQALAYYDSHRGKVKNPYYLSVVDFGKYAGEKRFFIIDMRTGGVKALLVSHGLGSDPGNTGYAEAFSNTPESKQSSLGFYRTGGVYYGKFGLSMRLYGLSASNSNAAARHIVVHGYALVTEAYAGPSWGCLAVSLSAIEDVVSKLKGGSIIYAGRQAAE